MGGQQSDYSGLVIDGADATNNYFGENLRFARNQEPHRASRSRAGIPGGDQRLRAGIRPRYRRPAQRGHEVRHQRNPRRSARILPRRLTHRERRARRAFQHRQPKPVRRFSRLADSRKTASSCSSPPTFSARTVRSTRSSAPPARTLTACEAFLDLRRTYRSRRRRRVPTCSPLPAAPAPVGEGLFPACYWRRHCRRPRRPAQPVSKLLHACSATTTTSSAPRTTSAFAGSAAATTPMASPAARVRPKRRTQSAPRKISSTRASAAFSPSPRRSARR